MWCSTGGRVIQGACGRHSSTAHRCVCVQTGCDASLQSSRLKGLGFAELVGTLSAKTLVMASCTAF